MKRSAIALLMPLWLGAPPGAAAQGDAMSFFVTSAGPGRGGDLGGLDGADAHCQALAKAAGASKRQWRAYLSTSAGPGVPAVHARERIGTGPWRNAKGVVVAADVEQLHGPANNLNKQTALTEKGDEVTGRGDAVNRHDILTGSMPGGRAFEGGDRDLTCGNWTKGGGDGAAMVGHHDRIGLSEAAPMKSWNSSHPSRGCSPEALRSTGGDGLFYCFAAD